MSITLFPYEPTVASCCGCDLEILEGEGNEHHCKCYLVPAAKWRAGSCPRATHLKPQPKPGAASHVRVGQQKQKKGKK